MRHPFDGIIVPETPRTRRSLLKVLAGAVAGLFGWASTARAQGKTQKGVLSLVTGEAGSTAAALSAKADSAPRTLALKEDGGRATTNAIGEEGATQRRGEDGATKRRGEDGGVTTKALGEEGGGRATTLAIGEEGGKRPLPPRATTFAIGEEGGEKQPLTDAINEQG